MEYCGLKQVNVRESSHGGISRKGNPQKPKKAHSRRSCYKTSDLSQKSEECMVNDNKRCILRKNIPTKSQKLYKYSFDIDLVSVSAKATPHEILDWYKHQVDLIADILGYTSSKVIPTDKTGLHYRIELESPYIRDNDDLKIETDIMANPDEEGKYTLKDEPVFGKMAGPVNKEN